MKQLTSTLFALVLVLALSVSTMAQTAFVSGATGTSQFVDRVDVGLYISGNEAHRLRGTFGYASNGGNSDYLSTGLGLDVFIPNTILFLGTDVRAVAGEDFKTDQYGRTDGLDGGLAYSLNFGVRLGNVMIGTGLEQFVTEKDNISLVPLSARFSF